MSRRAPGPKGSPIWGSLHPFQADPLGFLGKAARRYGPITRLRFGPVTAHLINDPGLIEQVLSRESADFDKNTRSAAKIRATCGDSLLSGQPETWQRQRRLIQPVFQPRFLDGIDPLADAAIDAMFERWQAMDGQPIDITAEMMRLSIGLVTGFLFSADIEPERINAPLSVLLEDTWRRLNGLIDLSAISPRLHRPAFRQARREIDDLAFALIRARRAATSRPDDVLSRLLSAHEAEGLARMSDTELRDAAVTLLLSGHESLGSALGWAFVLLARNPDWQGGDPAMIWAETLRLYPPIWIIERRVRRETEIGGYRIGKGSSMLISPFVLHRDPALWPDPERFDPARFDETVQTARPRHAWLPFGLGPHRCVGLHLANRIAAWILSRASARFSFALMPGQNPCPAAGLTLRHAGPVQLRIDSK